MRFIGMLIVGMIVGCASQQVADKSTPVNAATKEAQVPVGASDKDAPTQVAEQETSAPGAEAADSKQTDAAIDALAKKAGYKVVTKDGQQLYCSRELVTGSRLKTRTECLTAAQLEQRRNDAQETMSDASRKATAVDPTGGQ